MTDTYSWIVTDAGKDTDEICDSIQSTDAPIITSLIADDPDDADDVYWLWCKIVIRSSKCTRTR